MSHRCCVCIIFSFSSHLFYYININSLSIAHQFNLSLPNNKSSSLPISFPPNLFNQLSEMFNRSNSPYLICYHGPKLIIERYGFNVELIVQTPTSMHGSSEVHTGYLYRRIGIDDKVNQKGASSTSNKKKTSNKPNTSNDVRVLLDGKITSDPLFVNAWNLTRKELGPLLEDVKSQVTSNLSSQRPRRTRKVSSDVFS